MARLVRLCKEEYDWMDFDKHEVPILFEDRMNPMVAKFKDPRIDENSCNRSVPKAPGTMGLKEFCQKLNSLSVAERDRAFAMEYKEMTAFVSKNVPCIGCRRCLDKLQVDLSDLGGERGMDPFVVTADCRIEINPCLFSDARKLHQTLLGDLAQCRSTMDSLTRVRKNNRCGLHSLENQTYQSKTSWNWEDIWDLMSADCRNECCTLEDHNLCDLLKNYLAKHKFCKDCKYNLVLAFHCLTGEEDSKKQKGFKPEIYDGLEYCSQSKLLFVNPSFDFVYTLIQRAETEIGGGTDRERHAKTLVAGQREVLTIVGLYMHERFQRVNVALRTFHASFKILYCASVLQLNAKFMETLEKKKGLCLSVEETCRELEGPKTMKKKKKAGKAKNKQRSKAGECTEDKWSTGCSEEHSPQVCSDAEEDERDHSGKRAEFRVGLVSNGEREGSGAGPEEIGGWEIKISKAEILRRRKESFNRMGMEGAREKRPMGAKGQKGCGVTKMKKKEPEKDPGYSSGCSTRESSRSPGSELSVGAGSEPIKGGTDVCVSCHELMKKKFNEQGLNRCNHCKENFPLNPQEKLPLDDVDRVVLDLSISREQVLWFRENKAKIQAERQKKLSELRQKLAFGNYNLNLSKK